MTIAEGWSGDGRAAEGREYQMTEGHEGVRSGEGYPSQVRVGSGKGVVPLPRKFLEFLIKNEVIQFCATSSYGYK